MSNTTPAAIWIRAGLLALPLYGAVLTYTTRAPQPDPASDPEAWARFVSSPAYLTEHITSNVAGTALVILGTVALGAFLTGTRAPRLALAGMTLAVTGSVLFTVPAMLSTFTTPAIGAAYLSGTHDVLTVQFPAVLGPITALALLLTVAGNLLLAAAIWRSRDLPRWAGAIWAAGTLVFYALAAALGMATTGASLPTQPVGAALLAISGAGIAWAAYPHLRTGHRSPESAATGH
jgi:hypothetical protein